MKLLKVATVLTLSVAFAATLAAAQATTPAAPAKAAPAKAAPAKAAPAKDAAPAKAAAAKAEMVKPADLPKAVTDAIIKAHPKATVDSAMKTMVGADWQFSVKITDGGKKSTLKLMADGMMVPAPAAKAKAKK